MRVLPLFMTLVLAAACGPKAAPTASTPVNNSDRDPKVDEATRDKADKDTKIDESSPDKTDEDRKIDEGKKNQTDKDTKVDEGPKSTGSGGS